MNKNNILGKYIEFYDKNHAQRTQKVVSINGKTLTVSDATGKRIRIHPDKNKILGVWHYKKLHQIEW